MFQYYYRAYDKYDKQIYALAIFPGNVKNYNPISYKYKFYDTSLTYNYKTYKLIDQQQEILANSDNPFALAILAGIYATKYKNINEQKFKFKVQLARQLFSKNWNKEQIDKLFRFLDGLIRLDESIGLEFKREVDDMIKKKGDELMELT